MAISDIVIIILFLATVVFCTVRGFAMTLYSAISTIVSVAGAFVLRPFVYDGLMAIGLDKLFYNGFYENINSARTELFGDTAMGTGQKLAGGIDLPDFTKKIMEQNVSCWKTIGSLDSVVEEMSHTMASLVVNVISIVLLVVIIMVGMHFLKKLLIKVSKMPVIRQFNRIGGLLAGIILGVFWISVLGMIAQMFSVADFFSVVVADIENSLIAKHFYDTNFIILFVSQF